MAGEYVEVSGYSQADIDDAIEQATDNARTTIVGGTNATQAQVLNGQTFSSAVAGDKKAGTMPNRGAVSATINPGTQYTIPAGYHNGSGIVRANANQNTDVYTPVERRANIDMGVNNAYRYVTTTQVPNANSERFTLPTPTSVTTSALKNMLLGANEAAANVNKYKYVDVNNVYTKGYSNGHADWENYISADNTYSNWWYPSAGNTGSWSVGITRHGIYLITMHAARFTSSADSEPGFTNISVSGGTLLHAVVNSTITHKPSSSAPERAHSTLVTIMVKVAAGATLSWSAKVTKACDVRLLGYILG